MARHFSGTEDINFGTTVPDLTANWSLVGSFRRGRTGADQDTLYSRWTGVFVEDQLFVYFTTGNQIKVDVPYVAGILTGSTVLTDTTDWHRWGLTRSGNTWTLYLDGAVDGTATNSASQSTGAALHLGYAPGSGSRWVGDLAEYAGWTAALDAAEMVAYNKRVSPIFLRPASCVWYAPLWGRHNPELDLRGGVAGVLTGTSFIDHPPIYYKSPPMVSTPLSPTFSALTNVGGMTTNEAVGAVSFPADLGLVVLQ